MKVDINRHRSLKVVGFMYFVQEYLGFLKFILGPEMPNRFEKTSFTPFIKPKS